MLVEKIFFSLPSLLEYMAEEQIINFDEMSFEKKKEFVISHLMKAYNFTDPTATTLDWSSSMPGLHVAASVVLTVIRI